MITLTGICVPLFAMWCNIDLLYTLQPSRYPVLKRKIYLILTAWCTLAFLIPGLLFGEFAGQIALPFFCNIPIFVVLLTIDAYRGWRYLFTYFTALMIPSSGVAFIVVLGVIFGNDWISTPICAGFCIAISFLVRRFVKPVFCRAQERNSRNWRTLTLVTIFVCGLVYLLAYYPSPIITRPTDYLITAATVIALVLCILSIVLELIRHTEERFSMEMAAQQASTQLRLMEAQYIYMEENQKLVRQLRHDMLHHVRIASGFLAEEQIAAAQEYLGHIGDLVTTPNLGDYCESRTGNITISWFASEAERLGIEFHCEADIPAERPEHSTDLCMVLANALQNALEASQQVMDKPYINVVAARQGSTLFLRVENSFDGKLSYGKKGELLTHKEEPGHGIGLMGIRKTVEKHSGYFKTSIEDNIFHLEVALSDLYT